MVPGLPSWLADVTVTVGPLGREPEAHLAGAGAFWRATPAQFFLDVPGVARYLVCDGRRIEIEPSPQATHGAVGRITRGTPLAALCYQRGVLALHAATAARDGAAVVLAGDSTTGKSTLLAELLRRGWWMLGDEVAPIVLGDGGDPTVMPTSSYLVL